MKVRTVCFLFLVRVMNILSFGSFRGKYVG